MTSSEQPCGGVVLLDRRSGLSHALDARAAAVWRACDGVRDHKAVATLTGLSHLQVAVIVDRLIGLDLTERRRLGAEVVDLASRRSSATLTELAERVTEGQARGAERRLRRV